MVARTYNTVTKALSITGSTDAVQDSTTTNNVESITFSKDDGFTVNSSGSNVTVGLGSHWKTLTAEADGGTIGTVSSITPTGQEDLTLQAGYGIKLTLDDTTDDQKFKIETIAIQLKEARLIHAAGTCTYIILTLSPCR